MRSKVSLSTKWYSRPCCSPCRGARVVYEIERWMFGSRLSSSFTSEVLPAPEGATTTNRLPLASLNVLHLLAHLLDEHLELHRDARHVVRDRLGTQGVGLAVQLLAEEIQALADGAALAQHAAEFRDVGVKAPDLLLHVDARGVEDDLLLDALVGGRGGRLGDARGELLLERLHGRRDKGTRL